MDDRPNKRVRRSAATEATAQIQAISQEDTDMNDDSEVEAPRGSKGKEEASVQVQVSVEPSGDRSEVVDGNMPTKARWEGGFLEEIHLENFRSYPNFKLKFGPAFTFLHGSNGSGKSTILLAIQIALGSKMALTGRGKSYKDLLPDSNPNTTGKVTLKMYNKGSDPYQKEKFGGSIFIQRKIRPSGTSTYALLNEDMKPVSTLKIDLVHLLDHYNIQVDNPLIMLNADGKNFFSDDKNNEKYNSVMRAFMLDKVHENIMGLYNHIESIKEGDKDFVSEIPNLERTYEVTKHAYEGVDRLTQWMREIEELKKGLAWAFVEEEEQGIDKLAKEEDNLKTANAEVLKYTEKYKNDKETIEGKMDAINNQALPFKTRLIEIQTQSNRIAQELKELKVEKTSAVKAAQKSGKHIDSMNRRINKLNQDIQRIKDDASRGEEKAKTKREQLKKSIADAETNLAEANNRCRQLEDAQAEMLDFGNAEADFKQAQTRSSIRKAEVNEAKQYLRTLSSKNRSVRAADIFLPNGQALLNLIDRNSSKFERKPIGPIGMFVKIRDQSCCVPFEMMLKNHAKAFVCHSHKDQHVLKGLFRQARVSEYDIHCMVANHDKPRPSLSQLNVPRLRPEVYTRIIDVLDLDVPVLFNLLIDWIYVDQLVVAVDVKKCQEAVFRREDPNLKNAYYITPDNRVRCLQMNQGTKADVAIERGVRNLFNQDQSLAVEAATSDLEKRQADAKAAEDLVVNTKRTLEELRRQDAARRAELKKAQNERGRALGTFDDLKEQLQGLETDGDQLDLIAELEESISMCEKDKIESEAEEEKSRKVAEAIEQRLAIRSEVYNKLQTDTEEVEQQSEQFREQMSEHGRALAQANQDLNHYLREESRIRMKLADKRDDIERLKRKIEQKSQQAREISADRCEVKYDIEGYRTRIMRTERRIAQEERRQGATVDELEQQFRSAESRMNEAKLQHEKSKRMKNDLYSVFKERLKRFKLDRHNTFSNTNLHFNSTLNVIDFSGSIDYNFKERSLDFRVSMNSHGRQRTVEDNKSFSGGERAFIQVAFLMSLWCTVESPFYCWDEYNRHMDKSFHELAHRIMRHFVVERLRNRGESGTQPCQLILATPDPVPAVFKNSSIEDLCMIYTLTKQT